MPKNIFKSNEAVDTFFEEGRKAFWNDVAATDNPYEHSDKECAQRWDSGWNNAQKTNESLNKNWEAQSNKARKTNESFKKGFDVKKYWESQSNESRNTSESTAWYVIGFAITAFVTFIGSWIYCIATYGFLLGVGLGWLPSIIVAVIVGALWPLIALAIVVVAYLIFKN